MKKELQELMGGLVTEEQLLFIQEHEEVENCSYEGLEFGHGGNYIYDVKLVGNDEIYSVTLERILE